MSYDLFDLRCGFYVYSNFCELKLNSMFILCLIYGYYLVKKYKQSSIEIKETYERNMAGSGNVS